MTGNFAFLNIGQVCLMLTKAAHPQLSFSEIAIVTIRAQQLRVYFYTSDQKVILNNSWSLPKPDKVHSSNLVIFLF